MRKTTVLGKFVGKCDAPAPPGALRPISLAPPDQEDDFEDVPIAEPYVQPSQMPSGAMSPLSQGPAD